MIALLLTSATRIRTFGLANARRVWRHADVLTQEWRAGASHAAAARFLRKAPLTGAILCKRGAGRDPSGDGVPAG